MSEPGPLKSRAQPPMGQVMAPSAGAPPPLTSATPPAARCAHGHIVAFYESESSLAQAVASFLAEGLANDEAAVVIATASHRAAFCAALASLGTDAAAAERCGRLVLLDAEETLAAFAGPDGPDGVRFRQTIDAVLDGPGREGRRVRAYGEMVAVLWAAGNVAGALALEDLWNELSHERSIERLCAYPLPAFADPDGAERLAAVCERHSNVVPVEGWADLPAQDAGERRRVVARLQQEVVALRGALRRMAPAAPAPRTPPAAPALAAPQRRTSDTAAPALARHLEEVLLSGDATATGDVLHQALAAGLAAPELFSRVVTPAMHAIGERWAARALTVADEHLATVTCHRAVAALYPSLLTSRPRTRERVLVAGVQGEAHGLAPRLVADVLDSLGYDVVHLGPDVPCSALAGAVARFEPAVVALSVTMPQHATALRRAVAAVQAQRPDVRILLGGQGVEPAWQRDGFVVASSLEDLGRLVADLLRHRPAAPRVTCDAATRARSRREVRDQAVGGQFLDAAADLCEIAREHALRAQEYRFLALEDPLTGLPNRRAFDDRLQQAAGAGEDLVLLVVDVDDFKAINDRHGHEAGDELLGQIGRAMVEALRPGDLVARLGGDEFGVLLAPRADVDAAAVAERLREAVQQRCLAVGATASFGGAVFSGDARRTAIEADRALYAAKRQGRNRVAFAEREPARAA